jgi:hypothetical protein
MDGPVLSRPIPVYPPDNTPRTDAQSDEPGGRTVPNLGSERNKSFLSLASFNLANSSSGLISIFSAAMDSVPDPPVPGTPPAEIRRERAMVDEVNHCGVIRDCVRSVTILFVVGYAFAMYFPRGRV